MDGKGRGTDYICIELFWRRVKCEKNYLNEYNNMITLKNDLQE
jgi:putative transposase